MVSLVEDDSWPSAGGGAPVLSEESLSSFPSVKSDNVVKGAAPEVIRANTTTNTKVRPTGTSARSRPSTKATDEPEKVDGRMVLKSPSSSELLDRLGDTGEPATRHRHGERRSELGAVGLVDSGRSTSWRLLSCR